MTGMYAEERHEAIATLVRSHGRISVSEVASTFGVTTETVRRDLASLERAGLLRRVHGGAVPTTSLALAEQALDARDVTCGSAEGPHRPGRPRAACRAAAAASCSTAGRRPAGSPRCCRPTATCTSSPTPSPWPRASPAAQG